MKLRNTIATGLGLAACLCVAIAATTAQQTQEREAYEVQRVTGNDLSVTRRQPADESATREAQAAPGVQGIQLDTVPYLQVAPGEQTVVVSDTGDVTRGGVPSGCPIPAVTGLSGTCGDTCFTQNLDPDTVLVNAGTVACSQANGTITVENSWARCFPGSDFPADLVLQCVDIGIESNTSPPDNPFDFDLRIVALTTSVDFPALGCPLPAGAPALDFGDPSVQDTWFDVGPGTTRPEFTVLHIQKIRIANDFQGVLKITLNKLVFVPLGTNLLVEIHAPDRADSSGGDNGAFRVGSNEANPLGDPATYIWAPQCGLNSYQDVVSIDAAFTADFVLRLDGSFGDINGVCCNNVLNGDCTTAPYGLTTFATCEGLPNGRFCPNTACPAPGAPFCPDFEGPGSPPCPFIIPNDDCAGMIILEGSVCEAFNSTIATDSGVTNPPGFETVHNDVFYGYIVKGVAPLPNLNGRLIVSTQGSTFDTNVAVYRVVAPNDIRIPADLALVCADIAAGAGNNAVGQANGFGDDIENRPSARINPTTYICITQQAPAVIKPGDQFVIRVGSPFPGVGGEGVLNVDYLPTSPFPPWSGGFPNGGRCCKPNGECEMVPTLADCQALSGFFRNITDFYFGRDPAAIAADPDLVLDALVEIPCVGCKTLPCAPDGEACYNALELSCGVSGTRTVTKFTKNKLYYKFQIPAGVGAIEIDTCGSTDAQGGGGFDTFLEVFKWDPAYPNNCLTNGEADGGDLPTTQNPVPGTTGPGTTGQWLVVNGQVMINDDCRFDDEPEQLAAQAATDSAPCYNNQQGTETDSCLCFPTNTADDGNNAGDWILICIGQFNPERDASGVNSIDPVENPTFNPVLASLTIRCLTQCFNCVLDTTGFVIGLVEPEPACTDPGVIGNNDGCNAILATSTAGPVTNPPTTTIPALALNGQPFYIRGTCGIFDVPDVDGQLVQHSDNDWYKIVLTEPAKLTWQLVQAEFTAQIAILRAGDPATTNLCNTTGYVVNTQTPCDDDTGNDLTIDVCAGTYYLMIRPRPPFKPVSCNSGYLCCVIVQPQKGVNCCPGDANNDGIIDGTDIQPFLDALLHPGVIHVGLRLGSCYEQFFCHADANVDGSLTAADADAFVTLLLSKNPCIPKADQCIDADRCQLPYQAGEVDIDNGNSVESGLISSDRNDESFDADASVPNNFLAADVFRPTVTGSVTDVCWWGAYTNRDAIFLENAAGVDCTPPTDDFTITYYKSVFDPNTAGQGFCPDEIKAGPFDVTGSFVANFPATAGVFTSALARTPTKIIQLPFGDVQAYRYEVSHPAVPVTAGECCWISIVNNTTGRCTWRWETSPFGDGDAFQHENRNQGLSDFPVKVSNGDPFWDCLRDDQVDAEVDGFLITTDLAFCLNILIGSNGCEPPSTVLGQCCFVDSQGQQLCVVVTNNECDHNYGGQFTSGGTCASPCPPVVCVVTCQAGDVREAEGCGFDKNGGCDDDVLNPPIINLGPLTCEDTAVPGSGAPIVICGTAPDQDQPGNDSDWFSFTTNDPTGESTITLSLEAQPDLIVELRRRVAQNTPQTDGCSEFLVDATSVDGDCTAVTADGGCLPNGEYLVRVLSSFTAGRAVPCDEATYRLTIKCVGPCCVFGAACPPFVSPTTIEDPALCNEVNATQVNNGCDATPNFFAEISAANDPCNPVNPAPGGGGTVFCGTSWADNNNNDRDWWLLPTLTTSTVINISFRSEFPGIVFMVNVGDAPIGNVNDCVNQNLLFSATFAASVACGGPNGAQFSEFSECVSAGNWAIVVQPGQPDGVGVFAGTPACSPRNHYQMRVTCGATDCAPDCFVGAGGSQLPIVQGINVGLAGDCGANTITRAFSDENTITNFRAADNFLVAADGAVSEVQWWGYYENTNGALPTISCVPQTGDVPDDFTITYYGDIKINSLIPGVGVISLPDNNVIGGPFSQSGGTLTMQAKALVPGQVVQITNQPPDFINMVEFRATHAAANFTAGTCVWMEITNNTTGGACTWSWAVSEEGDLKAARRDADPNGPNPNTYEDGDMCRLIDLAWCVDITTGPTGCFVFDPAPNDVCTGGNLRAGFTLTCPLGSGLSDQVTYDLINYSSQGPSFEPGTLGFSTPGGNVFNNLSCEVNIFGFNATPPKEAVAWFTFQPTAGAGIGQVNITLSTPTFAEILVFNPTSGATPVTCSNIVGAGEIINTQFVCGLASPPIGQNGSFIAGQTYLIMVAYYDGLVIGRNNIFQSLSQTLVATCP